MRPVWHHVRLDDVEVAFELAGEGDPVVLPHARPFVGWYAPLVAALPAVTVLRYHRTLSAGRTGFSIDDDAAICARLLHHVGLGPPHIVGHSYGGLVALALARGGEAVRSLAVLEPAATGFLPPEHAAVAVAPLLELGRAEGPEAATDRFLEAVLGDDARQLLDRHVPGARDEALAHAEQFFGAELPAVVRWTFGPEDAAGIAAPILNVTGDSSVPRFAQGGALIQAWFPDARRYVLPAATHLLMAQNPEAMAARLQQFWASC